MDAAFDIADSTDWLGTPLNAFSSLENALHCQVCKEFYDTPMITSCAHTFCSKCIRTSLSADGRCPTCRATDQASKLRNNWALQEIVETFLAARPAALEVARKEKEAETLRKPGKRKRAGDEDVSAPEEDLRRTQRKSQRLAASQTLQPEVIEVADSDGDADLEPEEPAVPDDGLVECPLGCGKRMKIEAVEPHLDRCEDERKQNTIIQSRPAMASTLRTTASQTSKPQDRISELSYSMMRETQLRKKLEDLGIPGWGGKPLMVKRHMEWVNLWNANCDSSRPRSKRELLHDLDTWERTQGGRAPATSALASNVMRKDFDGAGWMSKNKSDFERLIAEARTKKHNPALEEKRPKDVEISAEGSSAPALLEFDENMEQAHLRSSAGLADEETEVTSTEATSLPNGHVSAGVNGVTMTHSPGSDVDKHEESVSAGSNNSGIVPDHQQLSLLTHHAPTTAQVKKQPLFAAPVASVDAGQD